MAHMPDPFDHGYASANDETAEGDAAPDTFQYSIDEWLALATTEIPDPIIHGPLVDLMLSRTGGNRRVQCTTSLTKEQWLVVAMRRLPEPRDHSRLVEAWLRRCQTLDDRAQVCNALGAPVQSCNQWLQASLAALANPWDYDHLYNPWMDHYQAENGVPPRDSRRGFKNAVKRCLSRLYKASGGAHPANN